MGFDKISILVLFFYYNDFGFVFKVELFLELERVIFRKVLRKIWVLYCVEYFNRK